MGGERTGMRIKLLLEGDGLFLSLFPPNGLIDATVITCVTAARELLAADLA